MMLTHSDPLQATSLYLSELDGRLQQFNGTAVSNLQLQLLATFLT